jgi:hypothetical protein
MFLWALPPSSLAEPIARRFHLLSPATGVMDVMAANPCLKERPMTTIESKNLPDTGTGDGGAEGPAGGY